MQIFRNALSSRLYNCIPLYAIKIFRQWQLVHYQIVLHLLLCQYYLTSINYLTEQTMQNFKEISYQNYIQLRFNPKNLQETEQQEALLKYKRNAQLLAQIFAFDRKPSTTYKSQPVITQQHLLQFEREVEKQRKEGEQKCKQIQQKSNNYCKILKKIKQIRTEQERNQVIAELKETDLYDEKHPYFALGSPFFMNNTDEEVLEVAQKIELPDETTLSIAETK